MIPQEMEKRIVHYGQLRPCKTAFIDSHTPGSDQKENFTIIGAGVSEGADQHVHIMDTPGFNIGAAGQPPKCCNSLHIHSTAEAFFVLKGRWRFFWGRWGDDGEVVLEEGDIFNIPTGIFRGFENIGTDYGMIMSILGGNDAGGGVIWAPQVIENAKDHGLMLGDNGKLYDSKKGEVFPKGVGHMSIMDDEALAKIPKFSNHQVVPHFVARYNDLMAFSDKQPAKVIGPEAVLKDKPGFDVDFLSRNSISGDPYSVNHHEVLMVVRGHWRVGWDVGETILAPGDTCAVLPNIRHSLAPCMSGEASLYRVCSNDDPAGPTHMPNNI